MGSIWIIFILRTLFGIFRLIFVLIWNVFADIINYFLLYHEKRCAEKNNAIRRQVENVSVANASDEINAAYQYRGALVTGNNKAMRDEITSAIVLGSMQRGIPCIIMHGDKSVLPARVSGHGNVIRIGEPGKHYDPFMFLPDYEIREMLTKDSDEHLEPGAVKYLKGMLDFLHLRNAKPSIYLLHNCPHDQLSDNINRMIREGALDQQRGRSILQTLNGGIDYRDVVSDRINALYTHLKSLTALSASPKEYVNIAEAVDSGKSLLIDMPTDESGFLIRSIMRNIKHAAGAGARVCLVFDGASLSEDIVSELIESQKTACVFSYENMPEQLLYNDKLANSVFSHSSDVYITTTVNGTNAKFLSENIGTYKKKTQSTSVKHGGVPITTFHPIGLDRSYSYAEIDEPKLTVEELCRISAESYVHVSTGSSQITSVSITR